MDVPTTRRLRHQHGRTSHQGQCDPCGRHDARSIWVGFGNYLGAADAPFDQRSLAPDSLNMAPDRMVPFDYQVYTVMKDLTVEAGPIAPWFGQPGLGSQFFTGRVGNIMTLIEMEYLERELNIDVVPGPGEGGACGL